MRPVERDTTRDRPNFHREREPFVIPPLSTISASLGSPAVNFSRLFVVAECANVFFAATPPAIEVFSYYQCSRFTFSSLPRTGALCIYWTEVHVEKLHETARITFMRWSDAWRSRYNNSKTWIMHDVECQFPKWFPDYVISDYTGVITDALAHLWMDRLRRRAGRPAESSALMVMIEIRRCSSPWCAYYVKRCMTISGNYCTS